jgi:enamine deaminase RidA (YjgF/YER057c/UK114 family)
MIARTGCIQSAYAVHLYQHQEPYWSVPPMAVHAAGPLVLTAIVLSLPMLGSVADCARPAPRQARAAATQLPGGIVRSGNTVYLTVRLPRVAPGEQATAGAAAEARRLMDTVARTVAAEDMRMDDLVSVTVISTDDTSNGDFDAVYRSYFHERYPMPGYVRAGSLSGGAHFEVLAVAVRPRWLQL